MTAPQDPRTITAVVHGIVGNVEDLVQAQVRLAKVELLEAVNHSARAAKLIGIGAALAQLATGLLLVAAVSLIATRLPVWAAALIVGAVVGIAAAALIAGGVGRLKEPRSTTSALAHHGRTFHV